MKQELILLGPLIKHQMPYVESWYKRNRGTVTIRNQDNKYPYTRKTIKN